MSVWAISDLHLSFAKPIRREHFAARWRDHAGQIERNWRETVGPGDLVLLPGDLSMARNHRDLQPDLEWLERLPGTKVLSAGNHDQWWNSTAAVRALLRRSMLGVGADAVATHGVIVCGTAGAPVTSDRDGSTNSAALDREILLLEHALTQATQMRVDPATPIYVLWHYPPFDAHSRPGPCVERLENAGATACVYGHLHNASHWSIAVQGTVRGVRYQCVAADAIGFRPLRIDSGIRP